MLSGRVYKHKKLMDKILDLLCKHGPMSATQINDILKFKTKEKRAITHNSLRALWLIEKLVICKTVGYKKVWSLTESKNIL